MEAIKDKDQIRAFFNDPAHRPKASALFGFELLDFDQEAGTTHVRCQAIDDFLNPNGSVQGGIVTGFLDEAMSVALWIHSGMTTIVPTLEMKTSFLRPLQSGPCDVYGKVVRRGQTIGFTSGELYDAKGRLCATSTATAAIRSMT